MVDASTLVITLMGAISVHAMMGTLYQVMAMLVLVIKCFRAGLLTMSIHIDIDECDNGRNGSCEQVCFNTIGSYHCDCFTGYDLLDGYNCSGIAAITCVAEKILYSHLL